MIYYLFFLFNILLQKLRGWYIPTPTLDRIPLQFFSDEEDPELQQPEETGDQQPAPTGKAGINGKVAAFQKKVIDGASKVALNLLKVMPMGAAISHLLRRFFKTKIGQQILYYFSGCCFSCLATILIIPVSIFFILLTLGLSLISFITGMFGKLKGFLIVAVYATTGLSLGFEEAVQTKLDAIYSVASFTDETGKLKEDEEIEIDTSSLSDDEKSALGADLEQVIPRDRMEQYVRAEFSSQIVLKVGLPNNENSIKKSAVIPLWLIYTEAMYGMDKSFMNSQNKLTLAEIKDSDFAKNYNSTISNYLATRAEEAALASITNLAPEATIRGDGSYANVGSNIEYLYYFDMSNLANELNLSISSLPTAEEVFVPYDLGLSFPAIYRGEDMVTHYIYDDPVNNEFGYVDHEASKDRIVREYKNTPPKEGEIVTGSPLDFEFRYPFFGQKAINDADKESRVIFEDTKVSRALPMDIARLVYYNPKWEEPTTITVGILINSESVETSKDVVKTITPETVSPTGVYKPAKTKTVHYTSTTKTYTYHAYILGESTWNYRRSYGTPQCLETTDINQYDSEGNLARTVTTKCEWVLGASTYEESGYAEQFNEEYKLEDIDYGIYKDITGNSFFGSFIDEPGYFRSGYILPLPEEYNYLTSAFGGRIHPIYGDWREHSGIDLAAPADTPIVAVADGVVTFAGWNGGFGNCVIISHEGISKKYPSIETLYGHMIRQPEVKEGDTVKMKQIIGYVGSTGTSTGDHLHFSAYVDGELVDPLLLFDGTPSQSLPRGVFTDSPLRGTDTSQMIEPIAVNNGSSWSSVGVCTATAVYSEDIEENSEGYTPILVDPKLISPGSYVYFTNPSNQKKEYFIAKDGGGKFTGKNIGVLKDSEKACEQFGTQTVNLYSKPKY